MRHLSLDDLIADLAREAGVTEQQAGAIFAESVIQQTGGLQYFKDSWSAESWMSFRACENAKYVMSQVKPELYREWLYWKGMTG